MRYVALACDYDGTIAHDGQVSEETVAALERLVASGRRAILVTGREVEDLHRVFGRVDLFERVVAENGGVVYRPARREERLLTEPVNDDLVERLRLLRVEPLSVGRRFDSTWRPNDPIVFDAIRELGLELEIIFNKDSVMVLPTGVTKASGLQAALEDMQLSAHNVVGVGDAENDEAFMSLCEVSAAVANALPSVKDRADIVLEGDHGRGVVELIERILADDLRSTDETLTRHGLEIGGNERGPVTVASPRARVLVAGPSGGGTATIVLALLEQITERQYQFCLFDPEGRYEHVERAVVLGRADTPLSADEVLDALSDPSRGVVVSLLGLSRRDRSAFLEGLLPRVLELRSATGRPHWIVMDEAHQLLPAEGRPAPQSVPDELDGLVVVAVHPSRVSPSVLSAVTVVIGVGDAVRAAVEDFAAAASREQPAGVPDTLQVDEALIWEIGKDVRTFEIAQPQAGRHPHKGKYAPGDLVAG
jgi:HAD superfamily hydrolase (TIGR01484 family)